ncbi:MAG: HD domain-containing protein [Nanoarchaeota archaeon]|jgi:(p)ppGpp synthase/HD superfamily hydrolase|nr:HD domain-containing protein [Nanoarchaeota archaeon]
MIEEAIQFAEQKHRDQKRKFSGEPYITHPISVATIIRDNKNSHRITELITAAFLHDTLEDTNITEQELKKYFGEFVLSLVKELTTDENEMKKVGKTKYLADKMSNPNKMSSWALVIKLADRLDNVSDIHITSNEFKERYTKETNFILSEIEKNRELSPTQTILIKKIKECLQ